MSVLSIRDIESALDPKMVEQALRQQGDVSDQKLHVALTKQKMLAESGERIGLCEMLVRDAFLTRDAAQAFLQKLTKAQIDPGDSVLPDDVCQRYRVRPLQVVGNVLHLEAVGPLRPAQLEAIRVAATVRIESIKVIPVARLDHHAEQRRLNAQKVSLNEALSRLKREDVSSEGLRAALDALLAEAIIHRASDIHLECQPNPNSWISFRVDGKLKQYAAVQERIMSALFTRLKTEAGMDASDRLRSQDGRISYKYAGKPIDLRVASQPIVGGEMLTLRVLDPEALPSIGTLFSGQDEMRDYFRRLARFAGKRGELVLITGPTGSGKTATLYTLLKEFDRDTYNVITVEDPVEYTIPGVRQIQLNQILKQKAVDIEASLLRHDPDIIVFGELRNYDMARAAVKLTESGHKVFATLHANDSFQSFERFMKFFPTDERGDVSYVVSHYMRAFINQRLVPKLCKCAEPIFPGATERRAVGCEACNHTGYLGRVMAHDSLLLPSEDALRAPIARALEAAGGKLEAALEFSGVRHMPRAQVLTSLVETGLIDAATRARILEG